jgi:hypothetical protein
VITRFCTIVTDSYRAHAEVLRRSLRDQNPNADLFILNLDTGPLPFRIQTDELHRMAAMYTASQLTGALKPRLIKYLLTDSDLVIYLDADTEVFGLFDAAADLAMHRGVVLTPHILDPHPIFERWFLLSGMLNAGFVAVGRKGWDFVDWWAERTSMHAHNAPQDGYFQEQRWLDLAPALFGAVVLRDSGYNVMGWNLHERPDLKDLVFFHFCGGFDPHHPKALTTRPWLPWPSLLDHPAAAELCRSYASKLLSAGFDDARQRPYRYGWPDWLMRAAYRHALLDGGDPPSPFEDKPRFMDWLTEPLDRAGINRRMLALYSHREDLRGAFPLVPGTDSERYLAWLAANPDTAHLVEPSPPT